MSKKEYRPLTIPRLSWEKETLSNTFGHLIVQPLEPGFGTTIGNALRRILLGGIEGSAVTSVVIAGINNEFSSLEGVVEDVMQLVLHIKRLVIRNRDGKAGTMRLVVDKEGPVLASLIVPDEHLEIVNKEHVVAHVSHGGKLDITFFVEVGRGYQRAQWPADVMLQPDGRIYLDAMFSPVQKVMFDVEKTRVGEAIDYDKLLFKIYTDGSESPVDVLHYGVSVLRTQLEHFLSVPEIAFNTMANEYQLEQEKLSKGGEISGLKGIPVEILLKPVKDLELSVRASNCLLDSNITTILQLVNCEESELLKIKNFGDKSLGELREKMGKLGLSFNMNIKESDVQKALEKQKS
ncbi:MAG: DNA-directed RNA polymerase subunit alpha [Candidatus Babeliales bacterium]